MISLQERVQKILPLDGKTDSSSELDSELSIDSIEIPMEIDNKENCEESSANTSSKSDLSENAGKNVRNNVKGIDQRNKEFRSTKKVKVVKRPMFFAAETKKIFGREADKLFTKSEEEIKKFLLKTCHATRFYLAVKFYRRLNVDFETNAEIRSNYSKEKICEMLGVVTSSIKSFCRITLKDQDLKIFMKSRHYLSPVEFNPVYSKVFYRKYASNYEQLEVGRVFKLKKTDKIRKNVE